MDTVSPDTDGPPGPAPPQTGEGRRQRDGRPPGTPPGAAQLARTGYPTATAAAYHGPATAGQSVGSTWSAAAGWPPAQAGRRTP